MQAVKCCRLRVCDAGRSLNCLNKLYGEENLASSSADPQSGDYPVYL